MALGGFNSWAWLELRLQISYLETSVCVGSVSAVASTGLQQLGIRSEVTETSTSRKVIQFV